MGGLERPNNPPRGHCLFYSDIPALVDAVRTYKRTEKLKQPHIFSTDNFGIPLVDRPTPFKHFEPCFPLATGLRGRSRPSTFILEG